MKIRYIIAALVIAATPLAAQTPIYLDESKPVDERIEDALSRMTLKEKIAMLHAQSKFSSPGVPRLGIPEIWTTDGPHGIRPEVLWDEWDQAGWTNDSCVAFPALTCLAATWNTEMAALYGKSIGEEAVYRGKDVLLGPGVNIYRTPLNGRNFEYIQPEMTGSIFVLTKQSDDEYSAYILEDEDDIDLFLETQNISASETNRIIIDRESASPESLERTVISKYVKSMGGVFPSTNQMSFYARDICREMWGDKIDARRNPDRALLEWIGTEYSLYREVEHEVYWGQVGRGFDDMDSFLELAKKVTNTRKSRSGKSLEHQLHQVLLCNDIPFSEQAVTEESKTPDFIIPSISMYHDPSYPVEKLLSLAAKTTCKDRWRQILNEADRLRDRPKYLCTLQQGLSSKQLEEMKAENVVLVVPSEYIRLYPQHDPKAILSLGQFIRHVKAVLDV